MRASWHRARASAFLAGDWLSKEIFCWVCSWWQMMMHILLILPYITIVVSANYNIVILLCSVVLYLHDHDHLHHSHPFSFIMTTINMLNWINYDDEIISRAVHPHFETSPLWGIINVMIWCLCIYIYTYMHIYIYSVTMPICLIVLISMVSIPEHPNTSNAKNSFSSSTSDVRPRRP